MPFLRVVRDKRGYETTYLMHWYREGSRQRSKVLYVFRTPGGVRVGREPLEPDVCREIEAQHPSIPFQWSAVRDTMQIIETAPERRRRPKSSESPVAQQVAPVETKTRTPHNTGPDPWPVPVAITGATPDERVTFLGEWYPVARDQIAQRSTDPNRREALLGLAEHLNPAAWTDADQIATGIERAADALERLARVFTKRRRRSRPPSAAPPQAPVELPSDPSEPSAD